jgi:hypothetical protein
LNLTTSTESEWWRIATASRITGLSKGKLYELIGKNRIKSACLRDNNQTRGTRLIHAQSLRDFIEAHVQTPEGVESGE